MSRPEDIRKLRDAADAYMKAMDTQIRAHLDAANALADIQAATESIVAAQLDWADPTECDYPYPDPKPEPVAAPDPEPEPLVGLEEVRGELADLSRSGLTDTIRELIQSHGKAKLSELSLEQVNLVLAAAREAADATP